MRAFSAAFILCWLCSVVAGEPKKPKLNYTISKETTFVTGPLDKEGRIDYSAALSDRMGKGVTPETNANVLIWKALGPKPEGGSNGMPAEFFRRMGMDEPPEKGVYFVDLWKFAKENLTLEEREELEEIEEQSLKCSRQPWSAKTQPYLADWLKHNEKPLALFVEAGKRSQYFSPLIPRGDNENAAGLITALLPAVQKCRAVARALTVRAMLRLHEGKLDEAWLDLLSLHRMARHLGRGGTLIEALVGIAIEAIVMRSEIVLLDRPEIDAKRLRGMLTDLQAMPPIPKAADCIDGAERFSFLDTVMLCDRHGLKIMAELTNVPDNLPLPDGPLKDINWNEGLTKINKMYDRLSAGMRLETREKREAALNGIDEELLKMRRSLDESGGIGNVIIGAGTTPEYRGKVLSELLMSYMMPAVRKIQTACDRNIQSNRNLEVAFALAIYQRENKEYPKSLADLAPKYLTRVPNDVFNEKPIQYHKVGKGFLIYSVGPNGIDEEGRWYDDDPRGDDPNVRVPQTK